MKQIQAVAILVLLLALSGCGKRELILDGKRFGVREALPGVPVGPAGQPVEPGAKAEKDDADRARPIDLPPAQRLADWPQQGSNAQHRPAHAALAAQLSPAWSASIGQGDDGKHRITADPVVAGGRVFTLDSRARVMAHSTAGESLWQADLTPPGEREDDATGGGLAFGGGRLFVTTGFGALVALDPATGRQLWVQETDAAVTGAPSYRDGLVYLVSRDNRAWAIDAGNGRIQWQLPGTPSASGMVGGAAPALTDRLAVFPFGASELVATLRKSGVRVWSAAIPGQRRGAVYAQVTDITGDPVAADGRIYVATQSGRTAALDAASGDRIWTAEEGAYSPVLPVDDSVFLVSDQARLMRLDAATGDEIWSRDLPYFTRERPKRFKEIYAHYGPILAGGRLIVASNDGLIRSFSPETGKTLGTVPVPGGASTDPVVAGGTLYLVTTQGKLMAFR